MDYRDIQKLKAFFSALKDSGFKSNLNQIPTSIRAESLALLRKLPQFKGEEFKDDNVLINTINIYLKDPSKRKFFLDQAEFSHQQQEEFTKALEEPAAVEGASEQPITEVGQEQPLPAGEPASTMTGGGIPGLPSAPSVASAPRIIRNIPQDKLGGKEGGTGTGTAATNKAARLADKEIPSATAGSPVDNVSKEATQPARGIRSGGPVPSGDGASRRFQTPKISGATNFVKNFGSRANIFLNRNILAIARTGLGAFAGGALTGFNPLAMLGGGIGGFSFPAWGKKVLNGSINAGVGLSNQVSRGGLNLAGPKKKIWLLFLGSFFLLVFGTAFLGALTPGGGTTTRGGTGGGGSIASCKFTREEASSPIKSTILQGWIISAANAAGISPAVLASVAMHESPDFVAKADNNHDAIKTNNYCNPGKKFCEKNGQVLHSISRQDDPCTPDEIANGARTAQAMGLMQALDIYNPGKDLCKITESLAIAAAKLKNDGVTAQPTQEQINTAIRRYHNSCTYDSYSYCDEVWKDYQNCQQVAPPTGGAVASCPVPGGKITTSSFTKNPAGGHCSGDYLKQYTCDECGGNRNASRRADAIDVETGGPNGKDVTLPTVQNQTVSWKFLPPICAGEGTYPDCRPRNGGTGGLLNFEGTIQGSSDKWSIQFIHMHIPSIVVKVGDSYPPGTVVGKTDTTNHVHTTIGKNIADPNAACDPGWIPSDFMCDGSIPAAIAAEPISIGTGNRGTPITGFKIGNGSVGMAIVGSIHGKWEEAAMQFITAAKDAIVSGTIPLPQNLTIYFIPIINVDPWVDNKADGRSAFTSQQVDLNRDFDSTTVAGGAWSSLTCAMGKYQALGAPAYSCEGLTGTIDASSFFPDFCNNPSRTVGSRFYCAEGYSGSDPLSAPESQALANFLTSNNVKAVLSYHAPFGQVSISNGGIRVSGAVELAQLVAQKSGLRYDDFFPTYPVTGQLMDWLQDRNIIGVEVELPGPASALSEQTKQSQLNAFSEALKWVSNRF